MTEQASYDELMQSLNFTTEDVSANRNGELGNQQLDRLRTLQQRTLLIGGVGFIGFVLLATTLLYFGQANGHFILTALGIFTTMINAIFGGMYGQQYMRITRDIRSNTVEIIEGELERVLKADERFNNYAVRLDGNEFHITKEQFLQFKHESPYRFYRAPYSKVLLAVEPV